MLVRECLTIISLSSCSKEEVSKNSQSSVPSFCLAKGLVIARQLVPFRLQPEAQGRAYP